MTNMNHINANHPTQLLFFFVCVHLGCGTSTTNDL